MPDYHDKQQIFKGKYFQDCNYLELDHSVFEECIFINSKLFGDIHCCTFTRCDFSGAIIHMRATWCVFKSCDFRNANLFDSDLSEANFIDCKVSCSTIGYFQQCPLEGSFSGYKSAWINDWTKGIVKLLIPEDAQRSSGTSFKCRCSKAQVLEIYDFLGHPRTEAYSQYDRNFIYEIGKTVEAPDFDECRWNTCSRGIHFFMQEEQARTY